jgi:hypothetical protein
MGKKAFYLDHLRGPVERLLSELDRQPLGLAQLSKVTLRSSAPSLSSASTPPPEVRCDIFITLSVRAVCALTQCPLRVSRALHTGDERRVDQGAAQLVALGTSAGGALGLSSRVS